MTVIAGGGVDIDRPIISQNARGPAPNVYQARDPGTCFHFVLYSRSYSDSLKAPS